MDFAGGLSALNGCLISSDQTKSSTRIFPHAPHAYEKVVALAFPGPPRACDMSAAAFCVEAGLTDVRLRALCFSADR